MEGFAKGAGQEGEGAWAVAHFCAKDVEGVRG